MRQVRTLAGVLVAGVILSPRLAAGPSAEARKVVEICERHRSLADAFLLVARDLAVRARGRDVTDEPRLVLGAPFHEGRFHRRAAQRIQPLHVSQRCTRLTSIVLATGARRRLAAGTLDGDALGVALAEFRASA